MLCFLMFKYFDLPIFIEFPYKVSSIFCSFFFQVLLKYSAMNFKCANVCCFATSFAVGGKIFLRPIIAVMIYSRSIFNSLSLKVLNASVLSAKLSLLYHSLAYSNVTFIVLDSSMIASRLFKL